MLSFSLSYHCGFVNFYMFFENFICVLTISYSLSLTNQICGHFFDLQNPIRAAHTFFDLSSSTRDLSTYQGLHTQRKLTQHPLAAFRCRSSPSYSVNLASGTTHSFCMKGLFFSGLSCTALVHAVNSYVQNSMYRKHCLLVAIPILWPFHSFFPLFHNNI